MLHNPAIQFEPDRWFYFVAHQGSPSGQLVAACFRIGTQVAMQWTVDLKRWWLSAVPFPDDLTDHLEKRLLMLQTIASDPNRFPLEAVELDCQGDDKLIVDRLGHLPWYAQLTGVDDVEPDWTTQTR